MAERHSSENGLHGGPDLPKTCGVIGAAVFAMAAMTILMATQMSVGLTGTVATGTSGRVRAGATYDVAAIPASR